FGGARPAAVARELTKTYEEIRRGSLEELVAWAEEGEVLGEVVIVVAGAAPVPARAEDVVDSVLGRGAAGGRLETAAEAGARGEGGRPRPCGRGCERALRPGAAQEVTGRRPGRNPGDDEDPGTVAGVFVRRMRSLRLCPTD